MKHVKIFMLLLWFTPLLFLQASIDNNYFVNEEEECEEYSYPPHVCYRFAKEDFDSTLNISEDIIVGRIANVDELSYVYLKFSASQGIPYGTYFDCSNDKSDNYECLDPYKIGKMQVNVKDESMSIHVDYAQVSEASAPILHHLKSKDKTFSKGVETPCYPSEEPQIYVKDVKKGSEKEKLLQTINIKDVIIYDLDYHNDLVIAVGEDNSPKTRELASQEEYYESVMLRSTDGGKTWQKVGEVISVPYEKVIVFDEKKILVVSTSMEGFGGLIQVSPDGGDSWKHKDIGMIESFKYIDKEVIVTNIVGTIFRSKDSGMSWHEQVAVEEQDDRESMDDEKNVPLKTTKDDSISVLSIPQYRVDYEANTLTVQHRKKDCDCDQLSLPLTYNQSNGREGILGLRWSLGIETQITVQDKNSLRLFDALKGEEEIYSRDTIRKDIFLNGSRKIEQTKNGYMYTTCNDAKQYFNEDGYLTKIEFKEKVYTIHYQDKKISKVMEVSKGKSKPYFSFTYNYEGPSVTYHHLKERKTITFLKNTEGTLASILNGNQHIFHYRYLYADSTKLVSIEHVSGIDTYQVLYKFDYSDDETSVYDLRQHKEGTIKEKTYLFYSKGTEHSCIVNTLTKEYQNDALQDVRSDMNVYHFSYYDVNRKKLLFTEYDSERYGFDDMGRVNYHSRWSKEISLDYHPFGKIAYSTVKDGDRVSKYKYEYTQNSKHNLKKLITPSGVIELKYNKKDQINELIIDKYHLLYEYSKDGHPTKITVLDKGEISITYDDSREIKSIETVLHDKTMDEHKIALDVTQAMSRLIQRVSEGSIKNYPWWVR